MSGPENGGRLVRVAYDLGMVRLSLLVEPLNAEAYERLKQAFVAVNHSTRDDYASISG